MVTITTTTVNKRISDCTSSTITALHLVHIVFVVLVSVASALGNTWLFYLMLKRKKLRTIINVLLASLCATNIISSVLCAPVSLYRQYWGYSTWGMPVPFCEYRRCFFTACEIFARLAESRERKGEGWRGFLKNLL